MQECPHCGEPIDDDVESCPHCGSDAETGWKGDLDYYSVELPEDDLEPGDELDAEENERSARSGQPAGRWLQQLGPALLVVGAGVFLIAAFEAYNWWAVVAVVFLAGCVAWSRAEKE